MKYQVLFVEDDEAICYLVSRYRFWQESDFCLRACASNGREALERLEKEKFDLVITDIRMPVMDGMALMAAMRSSYPQAAVILTSTYSDFESAREGMRLGALDFIPKPIVEKKLSEALAYIRPELERRRRERQQEKEAEGSFRPDEEWLSELYRCLVRGSGKNPPAPENGAAPSDDRPAPESAALSDDRSAPENAADSSDGRPAPESVALSDNRSVPENAADSSAGHQDMTELEACCSRLLEEMKQEGNPGAGKQREIFCGMAEWLWDRMCRDYPWMQPFLSMERLLAGITGESGFLTALGELEERAQCFCLAGIDGPASRICGLMVRNLSRGDCLEEVAREMELSRDYVRILFKSRTGMGQNEYLTMMRMEYAKMLLEQTSLKVYEVGEQAGYGTIDYFTRLFKAYTGETPVQYRKRMQRDVSVFSGKKTGM